jgi:hypothetical protein
MTKLLLTGIAICTTLAVFAGNADAYKAHAHKTHKTTTWTAGRQRGSLPHRYGILPYGTRLNTGPGGNDPLYESCEYPWRHPDMQCPGANDGGG